MNEQQLIDVIKDNQRLIYSIINKYTKYYEFDDLYQVSVIGIMKAYNNYNENSNAKFSTYAYKYILSEVVSFVNNSKVIKTSREYNKRILKDKRRLLICDDNKNRNRIFNNIQKIKCEIDAFSLI